MKIIQSSSTYSSAFFLVAFVALLPTGWAAPETSNSNELFIAPGAESYREALLAWSDSLVSFNGEYRLTRRSHTETLEGKPPEEIIITYRFDGDNEYMDRVQDTAKGGVAHTFMARYEDEVRMRTDYTYGPDIEDETDHSVVQSGVHQGWPEPEGAFVTPKHIFQAIQIPSLREKLAIGESYVWEKDGQPVFTHREYPKGRWQFNAYFDQEQRPIRFEYGVGVLAPLEDIPVPDGGHALAAFKPYVTLDLGNYETIDGVAFPQWAQKVWIGYADDAGVEEAAEARGRGEIDMLEFQLRSLAALNTPYEDRVQDFDLIKLGTPLNQPLSKAYFDIDIPKGAYVQFDSASNELYTYLGPWYVRIFEPKPLAIIGGVCVLLLALGLWYRRRRA